MKIEIGESLVRSWARHICGCQLAELNWKPSPRWPIGRDHTDTVEAAIAYFRDQYQFEPFRQNASVEQFLRQAEIDVLGMEVEAGRIRKVLAVDVAFHTGGLNYGDRQETVERVVKKLFRTAIVVDGYFTGVPSEVVFAAPKINPGVLGPLEQALDRLGKFFSNRGLAEGRVRLVTNATFREEIVEPVLQLNDDVADTSELFLRSAQLIRMTQTRSRETPTAVLEAPLVDTLPITLEPASEEDFKRALLRVRRATIIIHYRDGRIVRKPWNATRFEAVSSVMGNLRSRPAFRARAWQAAGISKVEVRVDDQ